MEHYSEAYIGLDVSKSRNAVAVAEGGRNGEIRYLGEVDNTLEATRKLSAKLGAKYERLQFCYEAGPTGYGLHRWLTDLGHACMVVAPSLIPQRPGDRVKTNRRDAEGLAKLLRAGELTERTKQFVIWCGLVLRWCAMSAANVSTSRPFCCAMAAATLARQLGAPDIDAGYPSRLCPTAPSR